MKKGFFAPRYFRVGPFFMRETTPGLARHGGGSGRVASNASPLASNAARVRSDLTRSVFSTKLRIYRIGNLHGVTIRREFRHSVQIVEFEHVVTDRLQKVFGGTTRLFARDHPRPGQAWGRVRPSSHGANASPLASNAARVRSDLTRSVFSTKLRIYRIGNLHGVTIRREFRHSDPNS